MLHMRGRFLMRCRHAYDFTMYACVHHYYFAYFATANLNYIVVAVVVFLSPLLLLVSLASLAASRPSCHDFAQAAISRISRRRARCHKMVCRTSDNGMIFGE